MEKSKCYPEQVKVRVDYKKVKIYQEKPNIILKPVKEKICIPRIFKDKEATQDENAYIVCLEK